MKYTITALVDPFDSKQRNHARNALHTYGKLSERVAGNVVDRLFMDATNGSLSAIKIDLPASCLASSAVMRELRLYVNMQASNLSSPATVPGGIEFTITKSLKPDDLDGSVKVLQDYGELDSDIAKAVVKQVISNRVTLINLPAHVSVGAVKKIREFFVMHDKDGNAGHPRPTEKVKQQLLLWQIEYTIKLNPIGQVALILADCSSQAATSLSKAIKVSEIVMVTEVKGPFSNGHILSLRASS